MDFADRDRCKPVLHWLEFWKNLSCPSMGPNGGSVAMDSGIYSRFNFCVLVEKNHANALPRGSTIKAL
jgi:hypothetical protein